MLIVARCLINICEYNVNVVESHDLNQAFTSLASFSSFVLGISAVADSQIFFIIRHTQQAQSSMITITMRPLNFHRANASPFQVNTAEVTFMQV